MSGDRWRARRGAVGVPAGRGRRSGWGRGPRRVRALVLVAVGALLAGCASMPDSGDVSQVKASNAGDSQVRVYPVPPREEAEPGEIVDGFLEAMTGDDPGFAIARKYLTKRAASGWKPEERTTVLTSAPASGQPERPVDRPTGREEAAAGLFYRLSGRQVAAVDSSHAYQPVRAARYTGALHLVQVPGADGRSREWRIDSLPQGLLLSESDFQRNYRSVNTYYFASGQQRTMVADPVYIRQRQDPVTRMDPVAQTVRALLDGPTSWLAPVVESSFPTGAALREGVTALAPDDQNRLKVPLDGKAADVGPERCRRMAAQLLLTVGSIGATRIEQVELQRPDGRQACVLDESDQDEYRTDPSGGMRANPYFVDASGRLARLEVGTEDVGLPVPVEGPFGNGTVRVGQAAVARDERRAAVISDGGSHLRVASVVSDVELPGVLVDSRGARPEDRLSAPSWDGRDGLWVADRDPADPRLLMVPDDIGRPLEVTTPWLTEGVRVEEVKASADGVRIALLLRKGETTSLYMGRVERHGSGQEQTVEVVDLQAVAPRMDSVRSVSWAGPSRLVVLGKPAGGVEQVRYLQTDGATSGAAVPGLNQVQAIAAADDERAPLVAAADDGIVRLQAGANWQPMVKKGSAPVYPG
ncbi:LpqB family beta-propeller domain-containing protein [Streptomyces lichenis]|uniref:Lipoprotein LpqB n=1 Tax=Streptomyces lichenis TaxID=2306967 RepID=A0ABT0I630_9ACTN|nr:LpqB family beta-propeller domain-containing protein [Streptomyces lichenis]MCK8676765.1 LpqB family beta-propeller domain-containing protein [Streptomyces lichenis]